VDVTRACDISEEILRIYGFNKVEIPAKLNTSLPIFPKPNLEKIQNTIAELLVYKGFSEVLNNSLTKQSYESLIATDNLNTVNILNPLSQELNVMRKTLIFGLLENIQHNQNRQQSNLKLFEFGTSYSKTESGFHEEKHLTIAITGKKEIERWNTDKNQVDYFTLKGIVESVFARLGLIKFSSYSEIESTFFTDGQSLKIQGNTVAELGWITKKLNKSFDIKQSVYIADFKWNTIIDLLKLNSVKYLEIPKTFEVRRDFSLLINENITFNEIRQVAQKTEKKLLKNIELFDVYEGQNLEEGKKSYAVSFNFQDKENTLTDLQIESVMEKIKAGLETELNAQLR
jgi:phenylalanyl-tRNA synthetase beta chain